MKKSAFIVMLLLVPTFFFVRCSGSYSLTGSQIDAKTISIKYFTNKSSIINPTLSQDLTDAFIDKFVNQTRLNLAESDGELKLEGEIVGYNVAPVAVQSDQSAAMNRLTIKVNVRYTNTLDDSKSFEQAFSNYQDFGAGQSLSAVEDALVAIIVKRIVDDVFNKALVNW